MQHLLENRLTRLRRRLRWLLTLYGLSCTIAVLVAAVMLAGLADWLIHLNDPGVRFILGLAILGLLGWTAYRYLVRPLAVRFRNLDLAMRVERRYPALEDSLASTVEFLHVADDDVGAGSPAMRRAVVQSALAQAERLNLADVLETHRVRRVALTALGICVLAGIVVLANPVDARLAVGRLVKPFADQPWPKQTHLEIVDAPSRLARGDAFEVVVGVRRGRMPARAEIQYRYDGQEQASDPLRHFGDQYRGGLETVTRPFEFRVRGGDDVTAWSAVDVVPAPNIETLNVQLNYPEYSQREPETLAEGVGHIRALEGTRVVMRAKANKELTSALVRTRDGRDLPAELSPDGRDLQLGFTVQQSGSYRFALEDREGFTNREATRYEIRAIADQPPEIFIEKPSYDREVTAGASLPLRIVAKDDIGLDSVALRYTRSGQHLTGTSAERQSEPDNPSPTPASAPAADTDADKTDAAATVLLFDGPDRPERHLVQYDWELGALNLTVGSVVTFYAEATDFDNLNGPNIGRSRELRLRVVSPEDLAAHLADRQALIREALARVLKMQEQAKSQVSDLTRQLDVAGRLTQRDVESLQGAELTQRQVKHRLTNPTDGIQNQIEDLLESLRNNRIDDSQTAERLQTMGAEIEQLERGPLPAIEQQMTQSRKAARAALAESESEPAEGEQPQSKDGPRKEDLAEIDENQRVVVETLRGMLQRLSQWEDHRAVARKVGELIKEQEQLIEETREIGKNTITKKLEDLAPQEKADLARAAGRQQEKSTRLGRIEREMDRLRQQLEEKDPLAADALSDALAQAQDDATAGLMNQAARQLQQNRVGQASQSQQQALESLREMLDILQNRREDQLVRLVKKLREAEQELRELRKEQLSLRRKTEDAGKQTDDEARRQELMRLSRRQREIEQQAQQMARRLRRLQARQAGQSTRQASGSMQQAQQGMQQGEAGQAGQQQQEALEQLEQAQRELARARRQAEEQLAVEQLARISDSLQQMLDRQKALIDETRRLDELRTEQENWTRGQLRSLKDLSGTQDLLREETDDLAETLTAAEVFALTLKGAARNMQQAAGRLGRRFADDQTQQAQTRAADRLAHLVEALKPEQGAGRGGGGSGGQGGGGRGDGIPSLAQIKLLRSLQLEINQRTKELDAELKENEELSPEDRIESRRLSEEQGQLADLARNMIRPSEPELQPLDLEEELKQ